MAHIIKYLFYIFRKKMIQIDWKAWMKINFPLLKVYKTIELDHNISLWKYSWAFKNWCQGINSNCKRRFWISSIIGQFSCTIPDEQEHNLKMESLSVCLQGLLCACLFLCFRFFFGHSETTFIVQWLNN